MINGIIKLFYSEVVKSKMKSMSKDEYSLKEECKGISNIAMKIDHTCAMIFKLLFAIIIVLIALNINIIFGIGITLVLATYIIYKIYIENQVKSQVKESVDSIKNNIEQSSRSLVTTSIKMKINSLLAILLIGVFSDFNSIMIVCFITVFIFTIRDIYSNINK